MKLKDIALLNADYDVLSDSADILGIPFPCSASDPIETLSQVYSDAVLDNIGKVMKQFGESELRMMKHLFEGNSFSLPERLMFPPSISLYLLDYKEDKNGVCTFSAPEDLRRAAYPVVKRLLADDAYLRMSSLGQTLLGMVNIYGMIRKNDLISLLSEILADSKLPIPGDDIEGFFWEIMKISSALQLTVDQDIPAPEGDFWMVSLLLNDTQNVMDTRQMHGEFLSYRKYSLTDYFDAGDTLYPVVCNESSDRFCEILSKFLDDEGTPEDFCTYLWLDRQEPDFSPVPLMKGLAQMSHGQENLTEALDAAMDFLNHIPMWGYKGHTPAESAAAGNSGNPFPGGFPFTSKTSS